MKRILLLLFTAAFFCTLHAQRAGIKTNALLLGTGSPNVGIEFSMGKKFSFNLEGSYNPFKLGEKNFWKHWFVQPEFRWWTCHRYAGPFWGLHALLGEYNAQGMGLDYRYEGNALGAGITYGYSWVLDKHWNIEALLGAGYIRMNYAKYECGNCGQKKGDFKRNYFGPTRAAISLIHYF